MSKLDDDTIKRIQTQIEVGMRYHRVKPETKMMALVAMRLFMLRFGYEQVLTIIKHQGADIIANVAQRELVHLANTWTYAMGVEPPDEDAREGVEHDIATALFHGNHKEVNRLLYNILSRLRIREDMIENRTAFPPPMVQ